MIDQDTGYDNIEELDNNNYVIRSSSGKPDIRYTCVDEFKDYDALRSELMVIPSWILMKYVIMLRFDDYIAKFVEDINRLCDIFIGTHLIEEYNMSNDKVEMIRYELNSNLIYEYLGGIPIFHGLIWIPEGVEKLQSYTPSLMDLFEYPYLNPYHLINFLRKLPDYSIRCDSVLLYDLCRLAGCDCDKYFLTDDLEFADIAAMSGKRLHIKRMSVLSYLEETGKISKIHALEVCQELAHEKEPEELHIVRKICEIISKLNNEERKSFIRSSTYQNYKQKFDKIIASEVYSWMKPMINLIVEAGDTIITDNAFFSALFPGVAYSVVIDDCTYPPPSFTCNATNFSAEKIVDMASESIWSIRTNDISGEDLYSTYCNIYNLIISRQLNHDTLRNIGKINPMYCWMAQKSSRY